MNNFNLYNDFSEKILALPLWVKEAVYFIIKQNLKETLPCSDIEIPEENLYQFVKPEITYAGKKEYERLVSEDPESDECKFLEALMNNLSIIEITINNAWTLEELSNLYYQAMESQFVTQPTNVTMSAKAAYFSNQIRIGEYFKRIGMVDVDQLESAMRIQKESELANEKKGFASILIDLDLVTRTDTDNLLLIKQECKKRFVLNFNTSAEAQTSSEPVIQDNPATELQLLENEQTIERLTSENAQLKEQEVETTTKLLENEKTLERLTYENNLLKSKLKEILKSQK